jgi:hypothetical protein
MKHPSKAGVFQIHKTTGLSLKTAPFDLIVFGPQKFIFSMLCANEIQNLKSNPKVIPLNLPEKASLSPS